MKRSVVLASVLVLLVASLAATASTSSLFGTRFKVGTEIQFRVEDQSTWWWNCCCPCTPSDILGWRIATATGQIVFNMLYEVAAPASSWLGSWNQRDVNGVAAPVGQYVLYVDTTVGTMSRCFSIYDPCGCTTCWSPCWSCACQEVPTLTTCACRTSLVFVDPCTNGCFSIFGFFGCCQPSCTGCGHP